ncbi:MAG: N-acetyltransferase [Epsilonproteobacteria bacterium]|nr:N-acetyltransferase [Campylobacterota bacterium]
MIAYTKPKLTDIPQMQSIIQPYVRNGIILPRSNDEIATNIRSYILAKADNNIVGYVALHIHSINLGEIRSLVVTPSSRGKGVGKRLVEEALKEAKELGLKEVLALTYSKEFFEKLGFYEIPKEQIPEHKIWQDCIKCLHFPVCNEVALMKEIT